MRPEFVETAEDACAIGVSHISLHSRSSTCEGDSSSNPMARGGTTMRREILMTAFLFGGLLLAAQATSPVILKTTENRAETQITIVGSGFGSVDPRVKLGAITLTVNRFNANTIVADLPDGLGAGAYLLAVENMSTHSTAVFAAAIGQIGPAGPIGPAGAAGPKGATGPAGPAGTAGPQGPAGARGATGATGPQGLIGATGSAGPIGAKGNTGATGATGPQGATGAAGPQGLTGAAGPAGPKGDIGATGATGPQGPVGPQGDTGPQGPTGARGLAGLRGGTGAQGPAGGQVWAANVGLPADADGVNVWLGPASGSGNALGNNSGTTYTYLLPVPQSCTTSNFNVTATGAAPSSGANVSLGFLESGEIFASSLSCNLPALAGAGEVTCSSTAAFQLTQGERILMVVQPGGPTGYDNMHIFTSFTCQ